MTFSDRCNDVKGTALVLLALLSVVGFCGGGNAVSVRSADTGTAAAKEHVRRVRFNRVAGEPALFYAGDSTLRSRAAKALEGSWGDELIPYLRKNVIVFNLAVSGRSTKTCLEHDWTNLLAKVSSGDFVIVQFGYNDHNTAATNRCTTLDEYAANLKKMALDVRAAGASPVFVTPLAQCTFGSNGRLRPDRNLGDYSDRLKAVARELGIECLDMRAIIRAAMEKAGEKESLTWYLAGVQPPETKSKDKVHPSKEGAKMFAKLFVEEARARNFAFAKRLIAPPGGEAPVDIPVERGRPVKLTREAAAFFARLKKAQDEGRFYFSWLKPWYGSEHTYDPVLTNCWERSPSGGYRAKPTKEARFDGNTVADRVPGVDPLVYFLDFNEVAGTYCGRDYYRRNRAGLEALVKKAYEEFGAIPVFSWHAENPYTPNKPHLPKYGTGSMFRYRYTCDGYPQEHRYVIREILDGTGAECGGGRNVNMWRFSVPDDPIETWPNPRAWFETRLDEIASFIGRLKDAKGRPIPLVVRLWHECEDDWHWWGRESATRDEYVKFFRLTVDGIRRRTGGGAQLLFLYSPDRNWITLGDAGSKDDFMYRYPGDRYVDIIGYDDYSIAKPPMTRDGGYNTTMPNLRSYIEERLDISIRKIRFISEEAARRGKVCGLIETGYRRAVDDCFDILMRAMTAEGCHFGLVNIWGGSNTPPTPEGIENFRKFLADPRVLVRRAQ